MASPTVVRPRVLYFSDNDIEVIQEVQKPIAPNSARIDSQDEWTAIFEEIKRAQLNGSPILTLSSEKDKFQETPNVHSPETDANNDVFITEPSPISNTRRSATFLNKFKEVNLSPYAPEFIPSPMPAIKQNEDITLPNACEGETFGMLKEPLIDTDMEDEDVTTTSTAVMHNLQNQMYFTNDKEEFKRLPVTSASLKESSVSHADEEWLKTMGDIEEAWKTTVNGHEISYKPDNKKARYHNRKPYNENISNSEMSTNWYSHCNGKIDQNLFYNSSASNGQPYFGGCSRFQTNNPGTQNYRINVKGNGDLQTGEIPNSYNENRMIYKNSDYGCTDWKNHSNNGKGNLIPYCMNSSDQRRANGYATGVNRSKLMNRRIGREYDRPARSFNKLEQMNSTVNNNRREDDRTGTISLHRIITESGSVIQKIKRAYVVNDSSSDIEIE